MKDDEETCVGDRCVWTHEDLNFSIVIGGQSGMSMDHGYFW